VEEEAAAAAAACADAAAPLAAGAVLRFVFGAMLMLMLKSAV